MPTGTLIYEQNVAAEKCFKIFVIYLQKNFG